MQGPTKNHDGTGWGRVRIDHYPITGLLNMDIVLYEQEKKGNNNWSGQVGEKTSYLWSWFGWIVDGIMGLYKDKIG